MNLSAGSKQPSAERLIDDFPLPIEPRIIYDKNPLEFVICQLRFPSILKIETELPSAFQEVIRETFPLFNELRSNPNVGIDLSKLLGTNLPIAIPRTYQFTSSDSNWEVTLTRESLALSC